MEALVKLVAEKAGIPEKTAETAVDTVLGYLKKKLPAPLAGQIDTLLADEQSVGRAVDQADDLIKGLGGLLGKK